MAVEFAQGAISWVTTDGLGTTFVVSGLSFRPKFLVFYANGLNSAELTSEVDSDRRCIGFATDRSGSGTGTIRRRCIACLSVDNAAAMDTQQGYRDDSVMVVIDATPAVAGRLDLDSVADDGFTLIVDAVLTGNNIRLMWFAWGGSDITKVAIGEITEPAATGNQSYTVDDGSGSSFQPTMSLFAGCQLTAAAPTVSTIDNGFMVGAATGTGAGPQWVFVTNQDEGSASSDSDQYAIDSECLAMVVVTGGTTVNARAQFNGFDSVGFDLNWVARGVTNRRYIYVAVDGSNWKVGSYTINSTVLNSTATVSGLSFRPNGAMVCSGAINKSTAGFTVVEGRMSVGGFSSLTNRQAMSTWDENGTANAEIDTLSSTVAVVGFPTAAGAVDWLIDVNVINDDGFQMIVDDAGSGSTVEFEGFLTFGGPAVPKLPFQSGPDGVLFHGPKNVIASGMIPRLKP